MNDLAEYVARVMNAKELSSYAVARKSGNRIDQSYVNKIRNGTVTGLPSTAKLIDLARGLGVPEDDLFSIVRGIPLNQETFSDNRLKFISDAYSKLASDEKERADYLIEVIYREIQRLSGGR